MEVTGRGFICCKRWLQKQPSSCFPAHAIHFSYSLNVHMQSLSTCASANASANELLNWFHRLLTSVTASLVLRDMLLHCMPFYLECWCVVCLASDLGPAQPRPLNPLTVMYLPSFLPPSFPPVAFHSLSHLNPFPFVALVLSPYFSCSHHHLLCTHCLLLSVPLLSLSPVL